jgi:hypothetical protein
MLSRLLAGRRHPRVTSAESLGHFLGERAALVTQKTVIGYCNARTSLPLSELMRDKPFADAFEQGRWRAFAAVLEDMFVVAEGRLRPAAAGDAGRLVVPLVGQFHAVLSEHAGDKIAPDERQAAGERLNARLLAAQAAPESLIGDIARVSGARVYEAMPIHERFRRLDRDSIIAGVQFLMVGMAGEFDRRLDAPRIVADLLGRGTHSPSPVAR